MARDKSISKFSRPRAEKKDCDDDPAPLVVITNVEHVDDVTTL